VKANILPKYDASDNPTGCCPRFNPEGWDAQDIRFVEKPFVVARTKSIAHVPLNMGSVFRKTFAAIEQAHARDADDFIVLSRERSPWSAEHLFSVAREVPGHELVRLSGDYRTTVFEGPYKAVPNWVRVVEQAAQTRGKAIDELYCFYTTCPKCAKAYGKNYVVLIAKERDAVPAA
jgi:hypothetical protein